MNNHDFIKEQIKQLKIEVAKSEVGTEKHMMMCGALTKLIRLDIELSDMYDYKYDVTALENKKAGSMYLFKRMLEWVEVLNATDKDSFEYQEAILKLRAVDKQYRDLNGIPKEYEKEEHVTDQEFERIEELKRKAQLGGAIGLQATQELREIVSKYEDEHGYDTFVEYLRKDLGMEKEENNEQKE